MWFTSLFGISPETMISVVLMPIVKNKIASICSNIPVALASIVSKDFGNIYLWPYCIQPTGNYI